MSDRVVAGTDPKIGLRIYGTYVIQSKIAEGGMGAVYLATNDHGGHKVIKFLLAEFSRHPVIRERFLREARAATRLKGKPHIVAVDDTIELPDGQQAMVMEWLDGKTLERHLHQSGRLTPHHAFHLVLQIGRGLHELHKAGVVHRDLKPGNIFLTSKDDDPYHVILIDLGIAHDSTEMLSGAGLRTQTGATMGTPGYMAPEQFGDAGEVTPAADLYALAVVLWQMLAGEMPWGAVLDERVLYFKQKTETPVLSPDLAIPPVWRDLLIRALSPNPSDRPPSIHAFLGALASELRADPRLGIPSGAEMMASFSKRLLRDAPVDLETVRAASGDRMNALMWTPQRVTEVPSTPHALPVSQPPVRGPTPVLAPTVGQRPGQRPPPASPATITSSNGVATPMSAPTSSRRVLWVSGIMAASVAAGLTFGIVHRRGHTPTATASPDASAAIANGAVSAPATTTPPVAAPSVVTPSIVVDAGTPPLDAAPASTASTRVVPSVRSSTTTPASPTRHASKPSADKTKSVDTAAPASLSAKGSASSPPAAAKGSAANAPARPFNPDDIAD